MSENQSETSAALPAGSTRSGPRLVLISAVARDQVIGINNSLPWRLPEDLAFFKKTTMGSPVLMGRATYDSIGRPLPGRTNIVLTRDATWNPQNSPKWNPAWTDQLKICHSLSDALKAGGEVAQIFVIGGAQIYETLLPQADSLILTEIDAAFDGDAFFPSWDTQQFKEVSRETHIKDATDTQAGFSYAFVRYDRRYD